jgi:hypothetical protein
MASEKPAWEVTGQRPTTVLVGDKYVPAMVVYFRTRSGVSSSLTIDPKEYHPAKVKALIGEAVTTIEEVSNLKSS